MDKKLYVIGGWNGQRGITRCDIFDTEKGEWSNMAPLSTGIFIIFLFVLNICSTSVLLKCWALYILASNIVMEK